MTSVPGGVYLAAFESMFRTICSTYVCSPATTGEIAGDLGLDRQTGQPRLLSRDDAGKEPSQLERFSLDGELAALCPRQDEQILDKAEQPLGFDGDVVDQAGPLGRIVDASGAGEDPRQTEDRRDRRPELM